MIYINVQLLGLSGRAHSALHYLDNAQDVRKFRSHIKLLTCDLIPDPAAPPLCHLCGNAALSSEHMLFLCSSTAEVMRRMLPDLLNVVAHVDTPSRLLKYIPPTSLLTQFLLDCSSFNLPDDIRISVQNPEIYQIYQVARNWCYATMRAAGRHTISAT